MRFAVAIGILLNTLPAASEQQGFDVLFASKVGGEQAADQVSFGAQKVMNHLLQNTHTGFRSKFSQNFKAKSPSGIALKNTKLSSLKECNPKSLNADIGVLSCGSNFYCAESHESSLGGFCIEAREESQLNFKDQVTQCNPRSLDKDVGMLSCDVGYFCAPTNDTELGGACVPVPRKLEEYEKLRSETGYLYCSPNSPLYGSCDCEDFDADELVGTFTCSYETCFGHLSDCCTDTCGVVSLSYTRSTYGVTSAELCYSFAAPYGQSFCYGYSSGTSIDEWACFGSYNGEKCNSCTVDTGSCTMFDCSNVGLEDEFCVESFYPSILHSCYDACLESCSICPDGPVDYPDAMLSSGLTYTCGYVDQLASEGIPKKVGCTYFASLVQDTCCASTTPAPTALPTASPTVTSSTTPSVSPTGFPSDFPSGFPSTSPSVPPSPLLSSPGTPVPTYSSTSLPTVLASSVPTDDPSPIPTALASASPTSEPSSPPTAEPSSPPTAAPSFPPTAEPSSPPTAEPSVLPTDLPSAAPSSSPSTTKPVVAPTEEQENSPPLTCALLIQTSQCPKLLVAEKATIPCDCKDKCIGFVGGKFDKCDKDGSTIAGPFDFVAGCTFDMAPEGTFDCSTDNIPSSANGEIQGDTETDPDTASQTFTMTAKVALVGAFFASLVLQGL